MALPHFDTPLKIRGEMIKVPRKKEQKGPAEASRALRSRGRLSGKQGAPQAFRQGK
jgi:hypothetical protein